MQPMQPYQPHRISRSRLIVGLMIMAMLASCAAPATNRDSNSSGGFSTNQPTPVPSTPSNNTSKTTQPSSSTTTPSKPASTSGKGAVSGRGSSGFGSSYGYSGQGGK